MKVVLCVFTHPDDEIFVAGTLVHLATHGVEVHLLCVTHGENGAPGYPPIPDRAELGQIRTKEMHCAAQILKASSLHFLDYVDEVGPNGEMIEFTHQPDHLRAEIINMIQQTGAEVVLTHGSDGEYGHPAHKLVHRMVLEAAQHIASDPPLVYSFQADFDEHPDKDNANVSDLAHVILHTERYVRSHIYHLFECHATQSSWWIHLKSEKLGRPATPEESWHLNKHESLHRHFPPATGEGPDDPFMRWLMNNPMEHPA